MVLRDLWLAIGIITTPSKILNSPIGGRLQAFLLRTPRQVARFDCERFYYCHPGPAIQTFEGRLDPGFLVCFTIVPSDGAWGAVFLWRRSQDQCNEKLIAPKHETSNWLYRSY